LEQSKKIANASVLMAGGNILPSVQLSFGKNWQKSWDETGSASNVGFSDSQQISLSASVPIFPVVNHVSDYISARSNQKKTNFETEASKNGIELAVESSVLNLISYAKTVVQADVSLGYSQELFLQMEERFNNGMISSTELLDAEVMLKNARFSKISAVYSFMKAKSELMNLLSMESQEKLNKLLYNK
jgi:outer membrane protein TolC